MNRSYSRDSPAGGWDFVFPFPPGPAACGVEKEFRSDSSIFPMVGVPQPGVLPGLGGRRAGGKRNAEGG